MLGKFENEESLYKSYENLEKEFTKKCQELSRLKKEMAEKEEVTDKKTDGEEIKEDFSSLLEPVGEEASLDGVSEAFDGGESEKGVSCEAKEELVDGKPFKKEAENSKEESQFNGKEMRVRALEFLVAHPEAKAFSKDIAKELLVNKDLFKTGDPFYMAYLIVKDKNGEKVNKSEEKMNETDKKLKETEEKVNISEVLKAAYPALLKGSKGGSIAAPIKKKYSSLEDARGDLLSKYFS